MGSEASLVRPRFARGVRSFAATVDGAIAGYGWLSSQPEWIGELQLEIRPGRGEAYLWNCATIPAQQRRGVFTALLAGISNLVQSEGIRRLWIGSVAIPAEKAVGPSGFRRALTFSTWTLGPAHVLMSRPAADADPKIIREARIVLGSHDAPMRLGLSVRGRVARIH
jgi:GNAT superfamily N-acetyltransferase